MMFANGTGHRKMRHVKGNGAGANSDFNHQDFDNLILVGERFEWKYGDCRHLKAYQHIARFEQYL